MLCEPWITGGALLATRSDKLDGVDPGLVDTAALAASEILWGLTARRFPGLCRAVLRPAARPRSRTTAEWSAYLEGLSGYGYLSAWGACRSSDHGSCLDRASIDLGVYPLVAVEEVWVDGQQLDNGSDAEHPKAYRVDADRLLVRLDGGSWRTCQDPTLPETEPGTFAVHAVYGQEPPQAGVNAAAALAVELARSAAGQSNRLPARVVSVQRQGVSWSIIDPMTFLKDGLTGIYEVDVFLSAVNPHRQKSRPAVLSPDLDRARRTSPVTSGGSG